MKFIDDLKSFLLLLIVIVAISLILTEPWWTFLIGVTFVGIIVKHRKWKVHAFVVGFVAGVVVWFGANLAYDHYYRGAILSKIGMLMGVPEIVVLIMAGLIGGLLTGLAFHVGTIVFKTEQATDL